jgi:hypothetical protein
MELDTSFRKTLLEIEYTFYRTFPAAAHAAQGNPSWGVVEDGGGCSPDPQVMSFYPSTGASMNTSASSSSLSSAPAAFASAPSGRALAGSDVPMDCSIHAAPPYSVITAAQSSLSASLPNTVVHQGHPSTPVCPDLIALFFSLLRRELVLISG